MRFKNIITSFFGMALLLSSAGLALSADDTPRKLTFGSMSVGTSSYNRNVAMTNVMNEKLPQGWVIEVAPIAQGGAGGTVLVEKGKTDLAEGNNVPNKMMMEGVFEMGGKVLPKPERARSFVGGLDYAYHLIMFSEDFHKKAGVDTIEELIAKKIPFTLVTKPLGASGELGARMLLKSLGSSYEDIERNGGKVYHLAPGQMADMLRDGKADVSLDVLSLGQPATSELTLTKEMFFPQMSAETLKKLADIGYAPKVMPKGTWKNQNKDIDTMVNCSSYVVDKDIPDEVVYWMTKSIVEGKPDMVKQMPAIEQYIPEESAEPLLNGLPMHPGAVKYYKEVGLMK